MPNLLGAQAYHVEFDMQTPYHVCAGLQDNNTWCGPSAVRTNSGINNDDWYVISGGDGFQPLMDPTDARIVYAESQDGRMSRTDRLDQRAHDGAAGAGGAEAGRHHRPVSIQLGHGDAVVAVRSGDDLHRRQHGAEVVGSRPFVSADQPRPHDQHRSRNAVDHGRGRQGHQASPSTTASARSATSSRSRNPRRKQGVVWVGSDDGVVSVTQDSGKTWTNVTSKISGVPKWTYVADVLPSRAQAGTAYVAFDGHRGGDYNTYVFTTTDFGATWRSIASNLPKGEVARGLAEDRKDPNILYLGTETGLWVSWNKGGQWTRLKANLPTMPIYEIKQHPRDNDLILASHARGIWILDDPTPIQEWAKSESADAFVFNSEPATIMNQANDQMKGFEGDRLFLGQNPAPGATLAYRLKADAKDVKITIKDASGATRARAARGDCDDCAIATRPASTS